MNMKNKGLVCLFSFVLFLVGAVIGLGTSTYITLPENEELVNGADTSVYYSKSENSATVAGEIDAPTAGAVSVHFLELGNKYTGDCTYIKVGTDIDILIDCGSKSNSVAMVSSYLDKFVTDKTLEYVIVTHAHQDHYAGFATPLKVNSIFDLYECKNIITFAKTNQKSKMSATDISDILNISSTKAGNNSKETMYDYFMRELKDEKANGANLYTAQQIVTMTDESKNINNGVITLDAKNNITLEILKSYYYTNEAGTENDYSVCSVLHQGSKSFVFTGDLEKGGEEKLTEMNTLPEKVEVYKAGHHGSKTSSSMTLLNVIQPKMVCVCCCAGSPEYTKTASNQFPTKEFIENIANFTTQVYVTTLCTNYYKNEYQSFNGNIVVMSKTKDEQTKVCCSNNNTVLKDTVWFKENRLEMCKTKLSETDKGKSWLS